jgi:hypothetical protein
MVRMVKMGKCDLYYGTEQPQSWQKYTTYYGNKCKPVYSKNRTCIEGLKCMNLDGKDKCWIPSVMLLYLLIMVKSGVYLKDVRIILNVKN